MASVVLAVAVEFMISIGFGEVFRVYELDNRIIGQCLINGWAEWEADVLFWRLALAERQDPTALITEGHNCHSAASPSDPFQFHIILLLREGGRTGSRRRLVLRC